MFQPVRRIEAEVGAPFVSLPPRTEAWTWFDAFGSSRVVMSLLPTLQVSVGFPAGPVSTPGYWSSSSLAFSLSTSPCGSFLADQLRRTPLYRQALFTLRFPLPLSRLGLWAFRIFPQCPADTIYSYCSTTHTRKPTLTLE